MKKIIIADSLRDFVEEHVKVLAGYDNKIFYIKSGKEAIDIHRKEKADLIIIKPDSPDLTCEQLCAVIRGDEVLREVPILIVCSDKLSDIERCQKCGASDYITEPLAPATFLWKTTRLLNISERASYRVIVKVSGKGNKIPTVFCTSQNVSSSGILLETDKILNKGDKITCSFFLPNSVRIITEGEVVRVADKENGTRDYGVRFIDIPPAVKSQIASFIENWTKRKKRYGESRA